MWQSFSFAYTLACAYGSIRVSGGGLCPSQPPAHPACAWLMEAREVALAVDADDPFPGTALS